MEKIIPYINEHIGDEESKRIFLNRLMYSITDDEMYLYEVVRTSKIFTELLNELKTGSDKKIIFGCGGLGKIFYNLYHDQIDFECFIDSNYYGYEYNNLMVRSAGEVLQKYKGQDIYICVWRAEDRIEIKNILENFNVEKTKICDVASRIVNNWSKNQYFDFELMKINKVNEEVFVDGGCYNGDTSKAFIEWCENEYKHIYAYEPDIQNFQNCKKLLNKIAKEKVTLFNKGLWEKNDNLKFTIGEDASGRIDDNANEIVEVISIDESIDDKVTFIKLDVEGAEYSTVLGCKKTIQKYRPKLAISVYHKLEDIYEIPKLILEMNPYYKLFFRHYSLNAWETVLYAIDVREMK